MANRQMMLKKSCKVFLSQKRETSFDGLIGEISTLLDFDNKKNQMDSEKLAQEAYKNAKGRNNTVVFSFTAELKNTTKNSVFFRRIIIKS